MYDDDDFVSVWLTLEPCSSEQADFIAMKLKEQEKNVVNVKHVQGKIAIFTHPAKKKQH